MHLMHLSIGFCFSIFRKTSIDPMCLSIDRCERDKDKLNLNSFWQHFIVANLYLFILLLIIILRSFFFLRWISWWKLTVLSVLIFPTLSSSKEELLRYMNLFHTDIEAGFIWCGFSKEKLRIFRRYLSSFINSMFFFCYENQKKKADNEICLLLMSLIRIFSLYKTAQIISSMHSGKIRIATSDIKEKKNIN